MRFLKFIFALFLLIPQLAWAGPATVEFLLSGMTDSNGNSLSGGKVYTYIAGTTSNKTTWSDNAETTPHANPIILDANGRKQVFADGAYKFKITDSADNVLYTWDNLYFSEDQGVSTYAGATTGAANAYVATISPALLALTNGTKITFEANHTNTGAATLNVNGLGAIDLNRQDDVAVSVGEIVSGTTYTAIYEASTNAWLLQGGVHQAGTYTPTLTSVANITGSTAFPCQYLRIHNVVNVSCMINVNPTAGAPTATQLGVSLPFASALNAAEQLMGTCSTNSSVANQSASILADTVNDRAQLDWRTAITGNHTYQCIFTYRIL